MAYNLTYRLINKGTEYEVSGCTGNCFGVVIPNEYKGLPVTSIGYEAFYNCSSLTSIEIPNGVTSIGDGAFRKCSSLTKVVIPDSVTSIGYDAFSYCSSLTKVVIPNSVTNIDMYAFMNCSSLTIYCEVESKPSGWSLSWNYSNRPVVWNCNNNDVASDGYIYVVVDNIRYSIKDGVATVVRQASNIQTANILANITHKGTAYNVTSIDASAFRDCTSLTSVVIPDSVTTIGERAFYYCTSLTSVVIPDSVTSIGNSAFYDCDSLTSIAILAKTPPTIGSYIFSNISETAKFYCYHSAIGAYKTAANWNKYIDKFIADGIGLYFAMSAQAQKKYFVSKDELHQYVQQYLHDNFAVLIAEYLTKN